MLESLGIQNFAAFLAAGIVLNITPGSDTLYILARSLSQGRRAGLLSVLGISTGACLHTMAAAGGLSMILVHSAAAFQMVKYGGAVYLVYMGVLALHRSRFQEDGALGCLSGFSARQVYVSGVLTNVLNPKVALFFLAFIPQFVSTGTTAPAVAFLVLGATFITTGTLWCCCLALFASSISDKLTGRTSYARLLHRISGVLFIGLGVSLALSGTRA